MAPLWFSSIGRPLKVFEGPKRGNDLYNAQHERKAVPSSHTQFGNFLPRVQVGVDEDVKGMKQNWIQAGSQQT